MGTKSKWKNGRLVFYNNAVVDEAVETTTAASALRGYGLSLIGTTINGTYTLGAPVKGVTKDICVGWNDGSSFVASVRLSTVANTLAAPNSVGIVSPSTIAKINTIVLTPGSTIPACIQLRGLSTLQWCLKSFNTTGKAAVSFTTACT